MLVRQNKQRRAKEPRVPIEEEKAEELEKKKSFLNLTELEDKLNVLHESKNGLYHMLGEGQKEKLANHKKYNKLKKIMITWNPSKI